MRLDVVFGTRAEFLKLLPIIRKCRSSATIETRVIFTAQQPELVKPFLESFEVVPDVTLTGDPEETSLTSILGAMVRQLDQMFQENRPDHVIVQGDTLTTLAGALAAFYLHIPVAHVEAGLRTRDIRRPFPEEFHRTAVTRIASLHFCPTENAAENLRQEGVPDERIVITGNTSIDTLRLVGALDEPPVAGHGPGDRTFLVTLHRREIRSMLVSDVLPALESLINDIRNLKLVWVEHPGVSERTIRDFWKHSDRVSVVNPMLHDEFITLLKSVSGVMTDSGGVTEECAAMGVPAILVRDVTERPESLDAGNAILVGTRRQDIEAGVKKLLMAPDGLITFARASGVFGDGHATERILSRLTGETS